MFFALVQLEASTYNVQPIYTVGSNYSLLISFKIYKNAVELKKGTTIKLSDANHNIAYYKYPIRPTNIASFYDGAWYFRATFYLRYGVELPWSLDNRLILDSYGEQIETNNIEKSMELFSTITSWYGNSVSNTNIMIKFIELLYTAINTASNTTDKLHYFSELDSLKSKSKPGFIKEYVSNMHIKKKKLFLMSKYDYAKYLYNLNSYGSYKEYKNDFKQYASQYNISVKVFQVIDSNHILVSLDHYNYLYDWVNPTSSETICIELNRKHALYDGVSMVFPSFGISEVSVYSYITAVGAKATVKKYKVTMYEVQY
jgi:hypothetical protein